MAALVPGGVPFTFWRRGSCSMLRSWWKRWGNGRLRPSKKRGSKCAGHGFRRLFLEPLEDRCVPSGSWETLASMSTPRIAAMAGAIDGIVYVVGGVNNSGTQATVE